MMDDNNRYKSLRPKEVHIHDDRLWVHLRDGRIIATPLAWYSWLAQASPEQQSQVELLPDGVYWTELDEGLEIEGMLQGIRPAIAEHRDSQPEKLTANN